MTYISLSYIGHCFKIWRIYQRTKSDNGAQTSTESYKWLLYNAYIRKKKSTSLSMICVFAQIIQSWKTLISKITIRNFSACTQKKKIHVTFKIWRIVQRTKSNKNGAQNTFKYQKGIIKIAIILGVSAHVRKKLPCLY